MDHPAPDRWIPSTGKAVMTATEAAYYLGMTEGALRKMSEEGRIPYRKQGGKLIFVIKDIDSYLAQLPGVTVDQAIQTLGGREHPVETPTSPRPARTSWRPDYDPADPIVLVRRPALPKQRYEGVER